ncbi:class I SAM-dependent methyltransferase [Peribacillus alkalitolerans]|uniref:class I SAM-dependent methyltransferase n=1 Tax=Peribacillus alkalitolerans TaxID=1550385 RepID=UPI0013D50DF3|nr:class I SAM-dependent methyltransferase [Peribacillus alkalitolerans]
MKLQRILPFARELLQMAVQEGDVAVDATAGNGHDTLLLSKLVGEAGHVFSFDIQEQAIENTRAKLAENELNHRVTLVHHGHEHIKKYITKDLYGKVTGAIFNLGYLPGGDKSIATYSQTTIDAIEQLLEIMAPEGIIVLVIYHGHEEGAKEKEDLLEFVTSLPQDLAHVLNYSFMNQKNNPPFIIAIEKRGK